MIGLVTIILKPKPHERQLAIKVDYMDRCRRKRNIAEYDRTDVVTERDAQELTEFTRELRAAMLEWLEQHHPNLVPEGRA
ncbi:MAG TPA: hypothetical protein VFA21_07145 [Pyrinomonadaceae bacterium]|nr:hypothetical protein [Pyrinomonadaceae bacterium]